MRKTRMIFMLFFALLSMTLLSAESRYGDYTISDAFTFRNLSIFLIRGRNTIKADSFLTLDEAIRQGKIVVYETEEVNQLSVKNTSKKDTIFIQSGDIVKGGKQDRVIRFDIIIPPRSGLIPVDSFCVEQGRWQKRGSEETAYFHSADEKLSSKELKIAAKSYGSQSEVWDKVGSLQKKLSRSTGKDVRDRKSESSLQLTLENSDVKKETARYVKQLSGIVKNYGDVTGFVFAVNGEINSSDIYAHNKLFLKLWPKMLKAAAVEAVAEYDSRAGYELLTSRDIRRWLERTDEGAKKAARINKHTDGVVSDNEEYYMMETYGEKDRENWIHKNAIKK